MCIICCIRTCVQCTGAYISHLDLFLNHFKYNLLYINIYSKIIVDKKRKRSNNYILWFVLLSGNIVILI